MNGAVCCLFGSWGDLKKLEFSEAACGLLNKSNPVLTLLRQPFQFSFFVRVVLNWYPRVTAKNKQGCFVHPVCFT